MALSIVLVFRIVEGSNPPVILKQNSFCSYKWNL